MFSAATARAFQATAFVTQVSRSPALAAARFMSRKAGVSEPGELKAFVATAGAKLLVVDVRNPDASKEPGDNKSIVVAALPSESFRPQAVSLVWDRDTNSMPLPEVPSDTPIITHCGGGGRGQKAKDFLSQNGFTKVLNGGGPKETDCWAEFGEK
jgi:rhodanese-related sulfurtransferase